MRERGLEMGKLLRYVAVAGIALVFLALSLQEIRSADFWWQLRTGQWVVEHRALPRHDEFTYTVAGREWIEIRWLFFVLTYLGWTLGGPTLLILAQTLILALAYLALAWPVRRVVLTLPGSFVLLLGVVAASGRFIVRPEIATFLLVSVYLVVLDGARRGRYARAAWVLPFAQALWNCLHTLFILGPVVAWLFVAGEGASRLLRKRSGARRLPLVALAITAACFANPMACAAPCSRSSSSGRSTRRASSEGRSRSSAVPSPFLAGPGTSVPRPCSFSSRPSRSS